MLEKNELFQLMKATALADRSNPVAYSFNGEKLSYDALNQTLRNELNEYAKDYAEYQKSIKPKKSYEERKIVGWKCKICGFVYEGSQLPADYVCPVCGYPAEDFEPIYEDQLKK